MEWCYIGPRKDKYVFCLPICLSELLYISLFDIFYLENQKDVKTPEGLSDLLIYLRAFRGNVSRRCPHEKSAMFFFYRLRR